MFNDKTDGFETHLKLKVAHKRDHGDMILFIYMENKNIYKKELRRIVSFVGILYSLIFRENSLLFHPKFTGFIKLWPDYLTITKCIQLIYRKIKNFRC